jgi:hypothetical protein
MDYKEAWEELEERIKKAESELSTLYCKASDQEKERLYNKLSGLRIAEQYMTEMKNIISKE